MEVAGMMYGVSMGKDGTSKVLAQRLDHPAPERAPEDDRPPTVAVDDDVATVVVPEPDTVG
jgi:hypothetical protein